MFKKRGLWQFYQPLRSGGVQQRSAETTDAALGKRVERLVRRLADDHRWAVRSGGSGGPIDSAIQSARPA